MSEKLGTHTRRQAVPDYVAMSKPAIGLKRNPRTCSRASSHDRFVEEGDVVAGIGTTEVRWIESGEIVHKSESAAVFWFRNGKIVTWQPFETYDAALKAAGLVV